MMSSEEINRIDQDHVWHPYASIHRMTNDSDNDNALPIVASAKGCELTLANGQSVVDGMSSWWACIHGYNHPELNAAAIDQIQNKMSHVMFGGLTHEPAAALAKELISLMPTALEKDKNLDKIFYCDSGSVAIEVAMKMALQYWYNSSHGTTKRDKFLTIKGGYHGDTFHAMSVCDPVNGMHHLFQSMLPKQIFCDRPKATYWGSDENDDNAVEEDVKVFQNLLEEHHDEVAAVILEPIVQGAGGMYFYSPKYLQRVRELCDEYDVLLICDEIATGFGRTGKMFAVEHAHGNVLPDILCVGKALSGGMMSFAATITSKKVASAFTPDHPAPVLMHGPTFMGNPLACAVSLASLQLLQSYDWQGKIAAMERQMKTELEPCRDSPLVQDVRVLGGIGVVQMKDPMDMKTVQKQLVQEEGVWLRPFGRLLYTMPPYLIQKDQLRKITKAMVAVATRRMV